jgi:transcriptional repressor NrdR
VVCPSCARATRVLESRPADDGAAVRRRRECAACGRRFTTFERRVREPLFVVKRDGERQPFDRAKLAGGLLRAAHKRPVDPRDVERLVTAIEDEAEASGGELPAERIGEACLAGLRELDRIAYLQFAAVYKGFSNPAEFEAELRRLGVEPPRKLGESRGRVPSDASG